MKKFIAVSSAAALTASMICAPMAIVAAEADKVFVDAFEIVMADQAITKGTTKVRIPVSFTKDVSFASADMKFSTQLFPRGGYDLKITSIESALPADSGFTADVSKDNKGIVLLSAKNYTLKKGDALLYINAEIQLDGVAAVAGEGATFKVSLDDCDIADEERSAYEFSPVSIQNMNSVVSVRPENATENFSVKIDSIATASKDVQVPVYVGGEFATFRTSFRVDGGAKIKSVDSAVNGVDIKDSGSVLYVNNNAKNDKFSIDNKFVVVTITLPDDVKAGDTFKVLPKFVDATSRDADAKDHAMYPSKIDAGVITYQSATVGDVTITNIKPVDKFIVSDTKDLDLSKIKLIVSTKDKNGTTKDMEVIAGDYFKLVKEEGVLDRTAELAYTGPSLGSTKVDNVKVEYLRALKGDFNLNGKIEAVDATMLFTEFLENEFGGSTIAEEYAKDASLAKAIEKYGIETVTELGKKVGDVDESGKMNTSDGTLLLTYFLEHDFDPDVKWEQIVKK